MKTLLKLALALATLSAVAYADSPQLRQQLQRESQDNARSATTVGVFSRSRGLGSRHEVRAGRDTRAEARFEISQDAHGNYRTFYRSEN